MYSTSSYCLAEIFHYSRRKWTKQFRVRCLSVQHSFGVPHSIDRRTTTMSKKNHRLTAYICSFSFMSLFNSFGYFFDFDSLSLVKKHSFPLITSTSYSLYSFLSYVLPYFFSFVSSLVSSLSFFFGDVHEVHDTHIPLEEDGAKYDIYIYTNNAVRRQFPYE